MFVPYRELHGKSVHYKSKTPLKGYEWIPCQGLIQGGWIGWLHQFFLQHSIGDVHHYQLPATPFAPVWFTMGSHPVSHLPCKFSGPAPACISSTCLFQVNSCYVPCMPLLLIDPIQIMGYAFYSIWCWFMTGT